MTPVVLKEGSTKNPTRHPARKPSKFFIAIIVSDMAKNNAFEIDIISPVKISIGENDTCNLHHVLQDM